MTKMPGTIKLCSEAGAGHTDQEVNILKGQAGFVTGLGLLFFLGQEFENFFCKGPCGQQSQLHGPQDPSQVLSSPAIAPKLPPTVCNQTGVAVFLHNFTYKNGRQTMP